jgi:ribonuclease VapC
MVVDSSALLAILLREPETEAFARLLAETPRPLISSFSVLETSVVLLQRKGDDAPRLLDALLHTIRAEVVSLNADQADLARDAYVRFGKGRHPAALNLGDCCSYALSRASGLPLLFKGEDFSQTDVLPAIAPNRAER